MVIFSFLIGGIVGTFLLYFLLQSRFALAELPMGQRIVCFGGCFVLLCIGDHWVLLFLAGCMAAFAMAYFIGQASIGKTIGFTVLFGVLCTTAFQTDYSA